MEFGSLSPRDRTILQEVLGYLNFSSGASDPRFLSNLNELYARLAGHEESSAAEPPWRLLGRLLRQHLGQLHATTDAFRQVEQADRVLGLVFEHALDAYRRHHGDLLFHQTEEDLFRPFFVGRMCESVLQEGGPWDESDRIVRGALVRLNDFVGHRPVAVLRTRQKIQPYPHERVRPIPLFIAGAGVAVGRYHDLIEQALKILAATEEGLLEEARFDPALLDELAVDPRAYDFDHPVNRRPNYHFGQWDPHHLDNQGRYRRFVLQQVTLDTMLARVEGAEDRVREHYLLEAAAVLAGTMLMGSGISGDRPEAHDSSVTLANLLPRIAAYRDAFYEQFLSGLGGRHGRRLLAEAEKLRQPLGGARQHLNRELARRRACQLQHVHLAQVFARMGYREAAARQAHIIPGAAARMRCQIQCRLTEAHLAIDGGQPATAAALLPEIEDLLYRAIDCGALVDPWNILGFGGQFSLFPAVENSVHDHRVDELLELMSQIFGLSARLQKEAAATGRDDLQRAAAEQLGKLATWWDQFATTEVSSVQGISGRQTWESAAHVADALRAWHVAGTAAGDVAFWRQHAERFHSPKAYALVVEALLEQRDLVAAMALLIQWLSQADEIELVEEHYSFHRLAARWMQDLWRGGGSASRPGVPPEQRWPLTRKFLDFLEANAGPYWEVPQLDLAGAPGGEIAEFPADTGDDERPEGLFEAAYEDVTYRDSTDDGFEGEMLEGGETPTDFELAIEGDRVIRRLAFWFTISRLWKMAASYSADAGVDPQLRDEALAGWFGQAAANRQKMGRLLTAIHRYRIPAPRSTHESLVEYEQRREVKENLLERVLAAGAETEDAGRLILATTRGDLPAAGLEDWEGPVLSALRAVFRGDSAAVASLWPELVVALERQPLLYIPTARGGNPQRIAASQNLQRALRRLLVYLPRLGLLDQTCELIDTIRTMEREHPVGPGAITEFDRLFDVGYQGIVRCVVASSEVWRRRKTASPGGAADEQLVDILELATSPLLQWWLEHSRNIRLSPIEAVADQERFDTVREFIQRYGGDWFTQQFMNYGNLRAILLQGVDNYLASLEEEPEAGPERRLLEDLADPEARRQAVRCLELILESVVEHYSEYMDYNSTTTQSDRGEMLFTLLDFLRLLAAHERVAWNLKPLVTAHEVLVRCERMEAAAMWREEIVQRTAEIADDHLRRLERLSRQYGMRLASVADRLGERFVRPLVVDRLRALVRPAMEELREGRSPATFARLEEEAGPLAEEPSGVGFDVPAWLEALDEEVQRVGPQVPEEDEPLGSDPRVPQVRLPLRAIRKQLEQWAE
jgi:hypothetical protein